MISLKDVAKFAGVSATTVSRVLQGNSYVTDTTRHKVLEAVRLLNYKPNAIAQSLRNSKTNTIGVLIPDVSNPYFMRFVTSLEGHCRNYGYSILLASSDEDLDKELEMLSVLETRTDGVVLATSSPYLSNGLAVLGDYRIPLFLVDREVQSCDFPTVVEENESSTYELVRHLIQLRHKRIAIINSNSTISTVVLRNRGYEKALNDAGITINPEFALTGRFDERTGYVLTKKLLANTGESPTALFCANNSITVGALIAIKEMGLEIPNDISIVSFGEVPLPELISPRITSVVQNPEEVGTVTARIVLKALRTDDRISDLDNRLVLPTQIRLGASVRPLTDG